MTLTFPNGMCLKIYWAMLGLSANLKYYLCNRPVDMRKGFDCLAGIARNILKQDLSAGRSSFSSTAPAHTSSYFTGMAMASPCSTSGWNGAVTQGVAPIRPPPQNLFPAKSWWCCWKASHSKIWTGKNATNMHDFSDKTTAIYLLIK